MKQLLTHICIITLVTAGVAQAQNCERFYDQEQITPILLTTVKRRAPSYVRSFRALVAHTPKRTKKLVTYVTRRIRPKVTWGTFGWDKAVATPRNRQQRELAILFAQGVERSSLEDNQLIELDLDLHHRFAREHRCLNRKTGGKFTSFGETESLR